MGSYGVSYPPARTHGTSFALFFVHAFKPHLVFVGKGVLVAPIPMDACHFAHYGYRIPTCITIYHNKPAFSPRKPTKFWVKHHSAAQNSI